MLGAVLLGVVVALVAGRRRLSILGTVGLPLAAFTVLWLTDSFSYASVVVLLLTMTLVHAVRVARAARGTAALRGMSWPRRLWTVLWRTHRLDAAPEPPPRRTGHVARSVAAPGSPPGSATRRPAVRP